jgi:surfactin synthase thioesterase subunit
MPESGNRWVRCSHPSASAFGRLICFPHAGGSASYFYPVSAALSPKIEVLAVQYPGRQDRRNEKNIEGIGELADRAFEAVVPVTVWGPLWPSRSPGDLSAIQGFRSLP